MRSYLVSYFYLGGSGRTFIDTSNDSTPDRAQIEEWERIIGSNNGVQIVGVTNFVEISGPAHQTPAREE